MTGGERRSIASMAVNAVLQSGLLTAGATRCGSCMGLRMAEARASVLSPRSQGSRLALQRAPVSPCLQQQSCVPCGSGRQAQACAASVAQASGTEGWGNRAEKAGASP